MKSVGTESDLYIAMESEESIMAHVHHMYGEEARGLAGPLVFTGCLHQEPLNGSTGANGGRGKLCLRG